MDLREKPGKVQKILELSLRFRLIFIAATVILVVSFLASNWNEMGSLPLAASEALGMFVAGAEGVEPAWNSAQYLGVAALAMFVMFFVFGGVRSGIAGIVSAVSFVGALFALAGSEGMQTIFFAVFAGVSLVLLFVAKIGVACALFPFALTWLLLTGFVAWCPLMVGNSWLVWAVLSTIGFASSMALALAAGKELGEGTPQAGALVKAGKKMALPVTISSLLALAALTFDMGNAGARQVIAAVVLWICFVLWFFGFNFGTMAFAPWERLRAGSRRVQMKEKKSKKK